MSLMTDSNASADVFTMSRHSRCSGLGLGVEGRLGHPEDRVHRGPDFVADVGEEL